MSCPSGFGGRPTCPVPTQKTVAPAQAAAGRGIYSVSLEALPKSAAVAFASCTQLVASFFKLPLVLRYYAQVLCTKAFAALMLATIIVGGAVFVLIRRRKRESSRQLELQRIADENERLRLQLATASVAAEQRYETAVRSMARQQLELVRRTRQELEATGEIKERLNVELTRAGCEVEQLKQDLAVYQEEAAVKKQELEEVKKEIEQSRMQLVPRFMPLGDMLNLDELRASQSIFGQIPADPSSIDAYVARLENAFKLFRSQSERALQEVAAAKVISRVSSVYRPLPPNSSQPLLEHDGSRWSRMIKRAPADVSVPMSAIGHLPKKFDGSLLHGLVSAYVAVKTANDQFLEWASSPRAVARKDLHLISPRQQLLMRQSASQLRKSVRLGIGNALT